MGNGIEVSYKENSTIVEFSSGDIIYPVKVYFSFDRNGNIAWETIIQGSNMWCSYPEISNIGVKIVDNYGNLIFNKPWVYCDYSDQIEIKFINWCRKFIFMYGRNPNGLVIGSHNGSSGEWVEAYDQRLIGNALLIEPNPKPFNQLVSKYQHDSRFTFKQIVVSEVDGFVDFYTDDKNESESSSLIQSNLLKNHNSSVRKSVKSSTPNDILKNHESDWLHIDAEGYDADIILLIDDIYMNRLKFIIWEHIHLSDVDKNRLKLKLESFGFEVYSGSDYNSCAIKK